ncbi:hypothetical protein LPZ50_24335, partial [Bordetella petrii]|nr:hypothetical protein [Bordetella petrii]
MNTKNPPARWICTTLAAALLAACSPAPNLFKRALQALQPQIGLWSTLPFPMVSELIAGAGFD